eukprot:543806-Pleurochrysis_carterae.AAC.1
MEKATRLLGVAEPPSPMVRAALTFVQLSVSILPLLRWVSENVSLTPRSPVAGLPLCAPAGTVGGCLELARSGRRSTTLRAVRKGARDQGASFSRYSGRAVPGQRAKKYPWILV